jgi:hypothetical protein
MDEFIENVKERDEEQNKECIIKFYANGATEAKCRIQANRRDDDIYKIKKRLLKKLKFKNYKS